MFGIGAIIDLIKTGLGLFQKSKEVQKDAQSEVTHEVNETNREEIRMGFGWRSLLGYLCSFIIFYSYVIVPVLDYFGVVVFQMPLGHIIQILLVLLGAQ